jgi:hypothetical protein
VLNAGDPDPPAVEQIGAIIAEIGGTTFRRSKTIREDRFLAEMNFE